MRIRAMVLAGGVTASLLGLGFVASLAWDDRSIHAPVVPMDPLLRQAGVLLYPSTDGARPPRAVVFFFGNDVGFWRPHKLLASHLSERGIAVAGFDLRDLLHSLPVMPPERARTFVARIVPIIERSRAALGGASVPLVIAGHSLGAEVALWTAAHALRGEVAGVMAMAPGSRSHLDATLSDILNGPEPTGPGSFSVSDEVRAVPSGERIAIVRGSSDQYRIADVRLVPAGGARLHRFVVPFAGHSLKGGILVADAVQRAMDWLLQPERSPPAARFPCPDPGTTVREGADIP
jgi:pimeloyl-ACP methyl ester carboxylesterase